MSAPRPRPVPGPRPQPDVQAAQVEIADVEVPEVEVPEVEVAPVPRATRSSRRAAEKQQGRRQRRLAAAGRAAAALLVVGGVAGFVALKVHDEPSDARSAPQTRAGASAPADPSAQLSDPSSAQAFIGAASSELVSVTELDYRRVDDALAAGSSVTTGDFRQRFRAALTGSAAAAVVANHTVTSVQILQAGIGSVNTAGTAATVLVFARVDQSGKDVPAAGRSVVTTLTLNMVRDGSQYLIADLARQGNAGLPPGTAGLRAAAEAVREEVTATLTYRQASLTSDLLRAQNGATGALLKQLTADATSVRTAVTRNRVDLTGAVTAVAVQQAAGDSVTMLVAATGTRTDASGTQTVVTDGRYVATVVQVSGSWLVSSLTPVAG